MRKKNGFTLVEMLAVIAVLILIMSIAIPSMVSMLNRSNEKAYEAQENEFISLAKIYATENKTSINRLSDDTCYLLSLNDMLDISLLMELPKLDDKEYTGNMGVEICKTSTEIKYTFKENSSLPSIFTMEKVEVVYDDLVIPSTGSSGNDEEYEHLYPTTSNENVSTPQYTEGELLPVVYDETCDEGLGCWRKADTTKNWYDYDNHMWANSVKLGVERNYCDRTGNICFDTLDKHTYEWYKNAPANTPISFDDIKKMYVWIPRYDYMIEGDYGLNGTSSSDLGTITINFNNDLADIKSGDAKTSLYTHPAFKKEIINSDGTTELKDVTGFWVEKFENGGRPYLVITHNEPSGDYARDSFSKFTGVSIHEMISNYEWSAIAYLSQSNYGVKTNSNCPTGILKTYSIIDRYTGSDRHEGGTVTGITQDFTTYDGRSVNNFTSALTSSSYANNSLLYEIAGQNVSSPRENRYDGYCGSTSGTVYGVYDMVGGFPEYVFLSLGDSSGNVFSASWYGSGNGYNNTYRCDGSTKMTNGIALNNRYLYSTYNRYLKDNSGNIESKKGDAINEISNWVSGSNFIFCSQPNPETLNNQGGYVHLLRGENSIFDYYSTNNFLISSGGYNTAATTRNVISFGN